MLVFALSVFILACNKTIVDRTSLSESLAPVNIDSNADLWKPVLITDPVVFSMSAPDPFSYPQFPFLNPPYAARAYAYVNAAQYDALIAAYHFKIMYRRSAPYINDSNIKPLIPKSSLPSFPSEDAVVAGATVEILKLLFPTEIANIEQKAAEEMSSCILSGANARGELTAGQLLGKQVADVFVARARTDRAVKLQVHLQYGLICKIIQPPEEINPGLALNLQRDHQCFLYLVR